MYLIDFPKDVFMGTFGERFGANVSFWVETFFFAFFRVVLTPTDFFHLLRKQPKNSLELMEKKHFM